MDPNPKRFFCDENEMPRDRFSNLNDSILLLITSFLPFRDSVRTSVLSRQWRNLWRSAQNVEFRENFFPGLLHQRRLALIDFMRRWIEACPERALDSLELTLSNPEEFPADVHNCISFALSHRVKHLGLDFCNLGRVKGDSNDDMEEQRHGAMMDLPDMVYNHTGLGSIRLFSCRFAASRFGNFVALKNLSLGYMKLNVSTISTLLENCPSLESLSLERCWNMEEFCRPGKHPRLKTLTLNRCDFLQSWYRIEVPNLRVFKYAGLVGALEVDVGQSIQEVELDFSPETVFEGYADFLHTLMWSLGNARVLTVCSYMLQVIPSGEEPLGMESPLNVRHLILKTSMHSCDFWGISFFLNSCPSLETLTIEISPLRILEDYESPFPLDRPRFWAPTVSAFECITSTLKVVEVKGFKGTAEEMYLLKHVMRYGSLMRNLNLYISNEANAECVRGARALMTSHRVSKALQIAVAVY